MSTTTSSWSTSKRTFGAHLPSSTQVARSEDLEVRYRVSRTLPPFGQRCLPDGGPVADAAADVQFDFDSAKLTPAAKAELTATAKLIREQAKGPIQVEGHTDAIGSASHNLHLSQRRAEAVRDALARLLGDHPTEFLMWGFGPSKPTAANKHSDGSDRGGPRTAASASPLTPEVSTPHTNGTSRGQRRPGRRQ
jgi:outer membrane protein OmpA-like peptidoglycan-associated protein